jgi:hypothetical protein
MALSGTHDPLGQPVPGIPGGPVDVSLDVGESMFETMGRPPSFAPSPEEMAKAMEEVRIKRKVELKEIVSRTYNLSEPKDQLQYTTDMEHIMLGSSMRTHVLLDRPPKQFVSDENGARYVAYLEWAEFRLIEETVPTVGA